MIAESLPGWHCSSSCWNRTDQAASAGPEGLAHVEEGVSQADPVVRAEGAHVEEEPPPATAPFPEVVESDPAPYPLSHEEHTPRRSRRRTPGGHRPGPGRTHPPAPALSVAEWVEGSQVSRFEAGERMKESLQGALKEYEKALKKKIH